MQWQLVSPVIGVFARWSSRRVRVVLTVSAAIALLGIPVVAAGSPQAAAPPAAPQDTADTTAVTEAPLPPLTGPRAQQDTLTAADQAPGTTVNVSLTDSFVQERLPFDVPFNVVGNVDTAVRRLDLTIYRVPASVDLSNLIAYLQKTVDCVGTKPPGRQVSKSSARPGTGGRFSLFVNALDPQYFYALCFVGVIPVPSDEINDNARRIILDAIGRLETEEDISTQMVIDVRQWMRARISDLGANRPVRAIIPPGNLFDEDPGSRNDKLLAENARLLRIPTSNLKIQRGNYEKRLAGDPTAKPPQVGLLEHVKTAGASVAGIELPTDTMLPADDVAVVENTPFDFDAFAFDSSIQMLKAAIAKASVADAMPLRDVLGDVTELARIARLYGKFYEALRVATDKLVSQVALESRNVDVALGSSALGADLNRSAYVSLDAGIAYPWRLETMVFYAGTNIYFRPINKSANLRYKGSFLHRFALTVGITTTVKDESRRANDLRTTDDDDTSNSLLLGGGVRVTPSIRVGAGVLVFKESDPNPLIDQTSVAVTPYVAFTADIDVAQLFRSLF